MSPSHKYFEVQEELTLHADQWFLRRPTSATGEVLYPDDFTVGVPYAGPPPVALEIGQQGKEVQFHLGAFGMPVVSQKVADVIRRIAPGHAEYFPVDIAGTSHDYEIMNVTCLLDCLDETQSEFTVWKEADDRPDLLGHYRMILKSRIDERRAAGHPIFRLSKFHASLFVSDQIQQELEDRPNLGVKFVPAS